MNHDGALEVLSDGGACELSPHQRLMQDKSPPSRRVCSCPALNFFGPPSLQKCVVKLSVKFELEFDLKFEISDGKIW